MDAGLASTEPRRRHAVLWLIDSLTMGGAESLTAIFARASACRLPQAARRRPAGGGAPGGRRAVHGAWGAEPSGHRRVVAPRPAHSADAARRSARAPDLRIHLRRRRVPYHR